MRLNHAVAALVTALLPAGCHRAAPPPPPPPHPHYAVGAPWQGGNGAWFYPAEQFGGVFTGLAVASDGAPGTLAADGEARDASVPAASVQTLQLPCVLRVTDLADGRQILVRATDRGPGSPGRLIGLNARARLLLGMGDGPTPVRIEIDGARSQALAAFLGGGPRIAVAAAPIGTVSEQSLPPPGSAAPVAAAPARQDAAAGTAGPAPAPPPLPRTVWQEPVESTSLWLDAGSFAGREAAGSVAAAIGGAVDTEGEGRTSSYHVRRGPFTSVAAADAALDQARRAGISGTRIVVVAE